MAGPFSTRAYAALVAAGPLVPHTIERRAPTASDVHIEIKFAGICHTDIHLARQEWGPAIFPMVPGHEIGGVVVAVGSAVTKFAVGDRVGVGCMVDSCRKCRNCHRGEEQYCSNGRVGTYNSREKHPHCPGYNHQGGEHTPTYGGYSKDIVVDESFVLRIPDNLDLAAATPLLCAGITVFSPMAHFGLAPTMRMAVAGLGGLGHMAVKLGVAWGCHVTVISRGSGKREEALTKLGAHAFLDATDAGAMKSAGDSFDFMINTIAVNHDINTYLSLIAVDGKMIMVGGVVEPMALSSFGLLLSRKTVAGSLIGGIKETQDMLNFCGRHNIVCEIERIDASYINQAYDRTVASDVKYRFVIDTATI
jgi:uncharacterized zinc-type alcohol dehydrogenase-like protein